MIAPSSVPLVLVTTIVSDVPTLVVKDIALASSVLEERVNWPPEILTSLPAEASISTPPAVAVNFIAPSSVPFVLVKTIFSLSAVVLSSVKTIDKSLLAFLMV